MTTGQLINGRPRPRVLALAYQPQDAQGLRDAISGAAPTVDANTDPRNVDLNEYDCVVSFGFPYADVREENHPDMDSWGYRNGDTGPRWWVGHQEFPPHISVIYVFSDTPPQLLDYRPTEWASEQAPEWAVMTERRVPGKHLSYVQGLAPEISELVKEEMAPRAKQRARHVVLYEGFRSDEATGQDPPAASDSSDRPRGDDPEPDDVLRPLLLGPSDRILAATYERSNEASAWLLPADLISNLQAWVVAAFREWHGLYPTRFPEVPDWQRSPDWESPQETALRRELDDAQQTLAEATAVFETERERLNAARDVARNAADSYERTLLTGTGTPLEDAVERTLQELGFTVQNMDAVWPEDARREDFRISDPATPGWLAISEVKGFQKGVSEAGLVSLLRSATYYAADEGAPPPAQWYIANSFLGQDPATRQQPFTGRSDTVTAFEAAPGLIIDTRALFLLLRIAREGKIADAAAVRAFLTTRTGVLSNPQVQAWVDEHTQAPTGGDNQATI